MHICVQNKVHAAFMKRNIVYKQSLTRPHSFLNLPGMRPLELDCSYLVYRLGNGCSGTLR